MRPILLKGHERAITCVKYNADGDLIFTASKDGIPTLWLADTGARMGTYNGHLGGVWDLDPSWDSVFLVTAGADQNVMVWEVETGLDLVTYVHTGPVRSVCWNEAGTQFASCSDNFSQNPPLITIYEFNRDDPASSSRRPLRSFPVSHYGKHDAKCTRVAFVNYKGQMDGGLVVTLDDGTVKILDPEDGDVLADEQVHSKQVNRISFNREKTLLFTCSSDCKAKMLDAETLEEIKCYETDRPVNAIAHSQVKDHILLGGGQDAMTVTTTGGRAGKFHVSFYEAVYGTEFGRVKGHFGPIHAIAIAPDGRSYASGSEDGYIRLHHFDQEYIEMEDPVPEETIELGAAAEPADE